MATDNFADFDLLIMPSEGRYLARVNESPVGQAKTLFDLPFTVSELARFTWLSGRVTRQLRPTGDTQEPPLGVQAFGSRLFEAVFGGEVGECLVRSLDKTDEPGRGLRINLHLNDVPELADLPWEYLYASGPHEGFLALSDSTPIVRYLEMAKGSTILSVRPPLGILVVVSDPQDVPKLDVEREWRLLHDAVDPLQSSGAIRLERLEPPTLAALQRRLRKPGDMHILHFIGHGKYDSAVEAGGLYFEKADRSHHFVAAGDLALLLKDYAPLRLAYLNACEGARGGEQNLFAGTAQTLVRQGIPAVLAMQFPVSDEAALALAHEFYQALADGLPVDAAVGEARKAVKTAGNEMEWGTPVLFSRSADNRLIELPEGDARSTIPRQPFEPETVLIPAGPFLMGSVEADASPWEQPQHTVELGDYRIGKYPVTNTQYAEFLRQTNRTAPPVLGWDGQHPFEERCCHPVAGVTWHEAQAYCNWLSEVTGRSYSLPSEAHWEKAARGDDGRIYPWGNEWDESRCHSGDTSTTTVNDLPPQRKIGDAELFDLVGNVREWTCSLWGENAREPDAAYRYPWRDDSRNSVMANNEIRRIYRGGAVKDDQQWLRCAARASQPPDRVGPPGKRLGFRVVMNLSE